MKRFWLMRIVMFTLLFCASVILFGFVVMWLWNWLMPVLFHFSTINYYQAVGLLALSKILFHPFGGRRSHYRNCGTHHYGNYGSWKNRWQEKMKNMTPEEKEQFRKKYEKWCGNKSWYHDDQTETTDQK